MHKWYWKIVAVVAAFGAVVIVVLLVAPKSPVSGPIKKQLTSTLLVPHSADMPADRQSVKYDQGMKLLTFNVEVFGVETVLSEQPTPDSFTDIPQVYDKMTEGMGEYGKFDTDIGTVHLTRPKQLRGKQAAVLNTKGTLLFAKPDTDLSDDQWRKLFGAFVVIK